MKIKKDTLKLKATITMNNSYDYLHQITAIIFIKVKMNCKQGDRNTLIIEFNTPNSVQSRSELKINKDINAVHNKWQGAIMTIY